MDTNDFSNIPQSLSEVRACRERDAALWTARDALIDMLRMIDRGEIEVGAIFIAYANLKIETTGFSAAGGSGAEIAGTAHIALDAYVASGRRDD